MKYQAGFRVIGHREVIRNKVQLALVTEQKFHAADRVQVPSQIPLTAPYELMLGSYPAGPVFH